MTRLGSSPTRLSLHGADTRGGGLPYERDGDARQKIRIKTLKETNLGVAQALFDHSRRPCLNRQPNKSYKDLNCAQDVYIECCILLLDFRNTVLNL